MQNKPRPFVSIIVPSYNENGHIRSCIESVLASDYAPERMELLIVDGGSKDGTPETVGGYAGKTPAVRLVRNPRRITPVAFNMGIAESKGEVIMILGGHSQVAPDYVSRCVDALYRLEADNVGGNMVAVPRADTAMGRAIVDVLSHPFGVGNAHFRLNITEPREVDTVFGGCYRRDVFDRIGRFNERLARSQDMEFNLRLKRAGGKIFLIPGIRSEYFARSDFAGFTKHNFSNGLWAVLPFGRSEHVPVSLRHLIPLAFASSLLLAGVWGFFALAGRWLFAGILTAYLLSAFAASLHIARRKGDYRGIVYCLLAFASLHFTYGVGSLWGAGLLARDSVSDAAKRLFDLVASAVGLLVLSPLFLLVALRVKIGSDGPVFYRGERIGRGGRNFRMLKFRTMRVDAEKAGGSSTADGDPRITPIGAMLRRYKLDELPQLINVLMGDMSIVGPRPQVGHDVEKYTAEERTMLAVRPGITDWSSIKFRNEGEILKDQPDPDQAYIDLIRPEKIRLQLHYVRNRSFVTDLKILWATLRALAGREVKLP